MMIKFRESMEKYRGIWNENRGFCLTLFVVLFFGICWLAAHRAFWFYCAIYGGAFAGVLVLLCFCYRLIKTDRFQYHIMYPLIGLFLGIIYMINLPMYTVPDEYTHMQKAYHMSNSLLGVKDYEKDGKVYLMMREKDASMELKVEDFSINDFKDYLKETDASGSEKMVKTSREVVSVETYPYIASSLGITLGRILHLSALKTFLLGRFFNLLLYVGIIAFALWMIPFGKPVVFTVALLPMSLQEGMSYAYDSWIIAHSLLLLSLFLSLYVDLKIEKNKWFYIRLLLLTVVSLLFITIKSHGYMLLCTLVLFLYLRIFIQEKKVNDTIGFLITLSYVGVVVGYGILFFVGLIKPDLFTYSENILEWSGTEGYTIGYLLHFPKEAIGVIYNTMVNQFEYYHRTMIGDLLGWLEKPMNSLVILGFDFVLIVSALKEKNENETDSILKKIFCWITVFTFLLINVGMLISWSPIEVHQVVGLQGRYFLPVLAVILLAVPSKRVEVEEKVKSFVPVMVLVLQFFAISGLMNLTL